MYISIYVRGPVGPPPTPPCQGSGLGKARRAPPLWLVGWFPLGFLWNRAMFLYHCYVGLPSDSLGFPCVSVRISSHALKWFEARSTINNQLEENATEKLKEMLKTTGFKFQTLPWHGGGDCNPTHLRT